MPSCFIRKTLILPKYNLDIIRTMSFVEKIFIAVILVIFGIVISYLINVTPDTANIEQPSIAEQIGWGG